MYSITAEKIESHLTVVFAATTVSRYVQEQTGVSIKRFVRMLAPVRDGVTLVDGVEHHVPTTLTPEIEALVTKLA